MFLFITKEKDIFQEVFVQKVFNANNIPQLNNMYSFRPYFVMNRKWADEKKYPVERIISYGYIQSRNPYYIHSTQDFV